MRQPWDVTRFAKTAFFFNSPTEVLKRVVPFAVAERKRPSGTVWSAARPELLEFGPLDDVVMGGISESSFVVANGAGVFAGVISTENNGGFAGTRSRSIVPALSLAAYTGLKLRVRGDGQRYKLIVRDDYAWNGIAWAWSFDAPARDEWLEVFAPFEGFTPTLFAKRVPGVKLKAGSLTAVQLTLSKFEYDSELNPSFSAGPFRLELESIEAY